MRTNQTKSNYRIEFDDWSEMLNFVRDSKPTSIYNESRDNEAWRNKWVCGDFEGGSFDGSLKLAREGWEFGAEKIQRLGLAHFEMLANKIEQFDPVQDTCGLYFDVGLVVQHIPECWQRIEITKIDGIGNKVIRINFNASVSAGISSDVMFARGAAVFALVELLELAGIRVELSCDMFCTKNVMNANQVNVCVLVKPADQPIDAARLAYALAHGGMLRRLGFACYETGPKNFQSSGYGMPTDSEVSKANADIYVGRGMLGEPKWESLESARAWILREIKNQGISIEE
jgi:hypothetical protein